MNTTYPEVENSIGMATDAADAIGDKAVSAGHRAKDAASAVMRKARMRRRMSATKPKTRHRRWAAP
ncbi:MAG: hypothetical protein SGI88_07145 [Candidatus Hydrogenedentes bacterium]|nr:hypothetical protein [Candidatus Hydrogenedentota bacterium]